MKYIVSMIYWINKGSRKENGRLKSLWKDGILGLAEVVEADFTVEIGREPGDDDSPWILPALVESGFWSQVQLVNTLYEHYESYDNLESCTNLTLFIRDVPRGASEKPGVNLANHTQSQSIKGNRGGSQQWMIGLFDNSSLAECHSATQQATSLRYNAGGSGPTPSDHVQPGRTKSK